MQKIHIIIVSYGIITDIDAVYKFILCHSLITDWYAIIVRSSAANSVFLRFLQILTPHIPHMFSYLHPHLASKRNFDQYNIDWLTGWFCCGWLALAHIKPIHLLHIILRAINNQRYDRLDSDRWLEPRSGISCHCIQRERTLSSIPYGKSTRSNLHFHQSHLNRIE